MQLLIEEARTSAHLEEIRHLETCVFEKEKGIHLPPLVPPDGCKVFRLLARSESDAAPIATVSVAQGEAHRQLLRRKGSTIGRDEPVARYTRLAVHRDYRGQGLCLRLLLEAQRRFVAPEGIRHTWLLFDAARAAASLLGTLLAFECDSTSVRSEYGACRLLFRDELSIAAQNGNRRGWAYLAALAESNSASDCGFLHHRQNPALFAPMISARSEVCATEALQLS